MTWRGALMRPHHTDENPESHVETQIATFDSMNHGDLSNYVSTRKQHDGEGGTTMVLIVRKNSEMCAST